jgi:hypothetical protein
MGGPHCKRKTIMQGSGRYHEKRWNVEFIDEVKKANSRALQLLKQRGSLLPEKGTGEATA